MSKILNPSQAKAVYDAMCALNNVSGIAGSIFIGDARIRHHISGHITIWLQSAQEITERYESQSSFSTAYGLNPDG